MCLKTKQNKTIHWVFFSLSPNEIQGCGSACLYVHAYISLLKPFFPKIKVVKSPQDLFSTMKAAASENYD